jgi:hypothetical protein
MSRKTCCLYCLVPSDWDTQELVKIRFAFLTGVSTLVKVSHFVVTVEVNVDRASLKHVVVSVSQSGSSLFN